MALHKWNRRRPNYRHPAILIVGLLLAHSPAVKASENSMPDLFELSIEELMQINVTVASLFDSSELDAPSTVNVITEQNWERRGARRMLDTVRDLPSTMVLSSIAGVEPISIRGYTSSAITGTATTWDGVPMTTLWDGSGLLAEPAINLGTLKSVQMIRGPGSALYGSDAFHGVLALESFESDQDVTSTRGQIASDGYYDASARRSGMAYDGARYNVAFGGNVQPEQLRQYSYTDPTTEEHRSGERAYEYNAGTASFKLISDPSEVFSYRFGLYALHYDGDGFPGAGTALAGVQDSGAQDTDLYMTQLALTRTFTVDRSVELHSYYWRIDTNRNSGASRPPGIAKRSAEATQYRHGAQAIYRDAVAPLNTRWALAIGDERVGINRLRLRAHAADDTLINETVSPAEGATREIQSALIEANTHWADESWRLTYGGRIDRYSDFGNHASPRLGLIYHPQPDSAIKLLYGNAFRAPVGRELNDTGTAIQGNPDLNPEILDSYELVFLKQSSQWLSQVTFYRSLWKDGIVFQSPPPPAPPTPRTVTNQGRNAAKGVEFEFQREVAPWLTHVSASYVESENTKTGEDYSMFPKVILNTGLGYTFSRHQTQIYLNQRFHFNADDVLASEAGFPAQKLPTYWRVDFTATKKLNNKLNLSLALRNPLDRNNILPSANASRGGIPDEPFNMNLGLNYTF